MKLPKGWDEEYMDSLPTYYSIDPGLAGTGWAEWRGKTLLRVGIVRAPDAIKGTVERSAVIAQRLMEDINDDAITSGVLRRIIIEMPQHMTNLKGIAAQAGAIYKLTFLVGYLARTVYPVPVTLVTPNEWKGQLPKDVVERRIIKKLGPVTCMRMNIRTHAWDAVGIGLWATGQWEGVKHGN